VQEARAEIGVFGGSGFYDFLDDVEEVDVETPYGAPSDRIAVGELGGRRVAFLARHGRRHHLPPHRVPYRANVWAMRALGVRRLLGPCAVGSLDPAIAPGSFVVCDQFVDRTSGRDATFYDGPDVTHVAAADPYCPGLGGLLVAAGREVGLEMHEGGTVVVIQGPRFSTRAESAWFAREGWQVVNMTAYPEAWLARELGLCYANLSLVTDYDVGVPGERPPVSTQEVVEVVARNTERLRSLLGVVIPRIEPPAAGDPCTAALDAARL
jgi:5'-methylthioadenosine phosphorylase